MDFRVAGHYEFNGKRYPHIKFSKPWVLTKDIGPSEPVRHQDLYIHPGEDHRAHVDDYLAHLKKPKVSVPAKLNGHGTASTTGTSPPVSISSGSGKARGTVTKLRESSFAALARSLEKKKPHHGELPLNEFLALRLCAKDKDLPGETRNAAKKQVDAEKAKGGWYVLAEFTSAKRDADHFAGASAVTLDFDGGTLTEEMIRSALEGQMYVALTTYSHSSEHPMWRVHVALSERVTDRGHYAAIVDVIHARFGAAHPMDPRSRLPEQFDFDHQHRRLRREYADVFASSDAASHIDLVDGLLRATRAELRACARRIGQASRG